jgi:hypothetical protein
VEIMDYDQMYFFRDELEKIAVIAGTLGFLGRYAAKGSPVSRAALSVLGKTPTGRAAMANSIPRIAKGPAQTAVSNSWMSAHRARPPAVPSSKMLDGVPVPKEALGVRGAVSRAGMSAVKGTQKASDTAQRLAATPTAQRFAQGLRGADGGIFEAGVAAAAPHVAKATAPHVAKASKTLKGAIQPLRLPRTGFAGG